MIKAARTGFLVLFIFQGGCRDKIAATNLFSSLEAAQSPNIVVDANRDGVLSTADLTHEPWSWQGPGTFVLPNLDDDDRDGQPDCMDTVVNGRADEKDLAPVRIVWGQFGAKNNQDLTLKLSASSESAPVRWFKRGTSDWQLVANELIFSPETQRNEPTAEFAIEACAFASRDWDGFLAVSISGTDGMVLRKTTLRVSPFLMLSNTAPVQNLYIAKDSTGRYENSPMLLDLSSPLKNAKISLQTYATDAWQEMWMQDTMEIGYAQSPKSQMHVVLNAPRGQDRFGRTLLGPDIGFLEIAKPRSQANATDDWIDWFGNLEVSPGSEKFPHGRIYYGWNSGTNNGLHPDVVSFLQAQVLQQPVAIDSGWLFIKHVDELLSFWPSNNKHGFVAVMPSPQIAADILNVKVDSLNESIQNKLDAIANGTNETSSIFDLFGIEKDQLLFAPELYEKADYGAVTKWSNPVNSVAFSSGILFGKTDMPNSILDEIKNRITAQGLSPYPLDDRPYQTRLGNVHCGTNSMRALPEKPFWSTSKFPRYPARNNNFLD